MANTVVFYKSKYGSTMKYAEWIAAELKADIFKASKISTKRLKTYSTLIFGGGMYMNKIIGIKALVKKYPVIEGKKIIIFSCGLTDPAVEENRKRIFEGLRGQVPGEMLEKVKVFHLHGGINYSKLSRYHHFMMTMLEKMLKGKREEDLSNEEKNMMETLGKDYDFVERDAIKPIVEYALNNKE